MAISLFLLYFLSLPVFFAIAQNISSSVSVPPLQWINLSQLLQGSPPPPLKDAAIGYDDSSRSLIIFGGMSQSGLPQSQTYLLNFQTLTWSAPSPPSNPVLQRTPPSRSAAVFGCDFAASNRHGFVIIGGKGAGDQPLSDIWEYDFINQFWSEIKLTSGGPSARWGASGGIDTRTPPIQDPIVPGPNNTLYLSGGFNGTNVTPLSDVWRLDISGTLSSNLPDSVQGSWDNLTIGNLPSLVNQAGAMISNEVIVTGGCKSSTLISDANTTCATQDTFIIDTQRQISISPSFCPVPRIKPVLVPNLNSFSIDFASQVFLLLGNFNSSLWQDSNGLAQGEVAILNINTGTWARILPSGDPGTSGQVHYPRPREGAAGLSFSEALVGDSRNSSADTIIFGGQDSDGNFLSDVWLLRSYSGSITPSNPIWSGFGNGKLQTGVNADGSGVRIGYLAECASLILQTNSRSPNNGSNASNSHPDASDASSNTSLLHKLFSSLSLVILMPVILFFRWHQISPEEGWIPTSSVVLVSVSALIGIVAYAIGVAGFILSFTTLSSSSATDPHLKTSHAIMGLVFFSSLYAVIPLFVISGCVGSFRPLDGRSQKSASGIRNSSETEEKLASFNPLAGSGTPSIQNTSPPSSPRPRTLSWDASNMLRPSPDEGLSGDSTPSAIAPKGFEVLNRPSRAKPDFLSGDSPPFPSSRSLGDIDWMLRRRRLNDVGELDYAISQAHNAKLASQPADLYPPTFPIVRYPQPQVIVLHVLVQCSIIGLSITCLISLWTRAPRYFFALFLIWVAVFYAIMIILACHRRPAVSLLAVTIMRLRGDRSSPLDLSDQEIRHNTSLTPQGPYEHHRPPYRVSTHLDELPLSHSDPDDSLDEDSRQRVIEEEMQRRDVSIITVPRRKLLVVNPS